MRLCADVVKSDIPLLLSSETLRKANCILDLGNDRICLFDNCTICDRTTSGLFVVSLGKTEAPLPVHKVCFALEMEETSASRKYLLKLHRQFGHLSKDRFCDLLKDAGKWKGAYTDIISSIYKKCKTCVCFQKCLRGQCMLFPLHVNFQRC